MQFDVFEGILRQLYGSLIPWLKTVQQIKIRAEVFLQMECGFKAFRLDFGVDVLPYLSRLTHVDLLGTPPFVT